MRRLKLPRSEFEQMYRRLVFNVVARNCDDHVKQQSFIMDRRGRWSLAPAMTSLMPTRLEASGPLSIR